MGLLSMNLAMTYDKSTMSGNMINVHGSDGEMTGIERWLGRMDTLHLPRSLVVQLNPRVTTLI
jgi:hypothetical protein